MFAEVPAALGAGAALVSMAWAVRGRASSVFAPSVWKAHTTRKAIALTFDDGPTSATPQLLAILAQYKVPATFFQIGLNVQNEPNIARAVAAAGHEIGNHSQTHPNFALQRPGAALSEFSQAQQTIIDITGTTPVWLRAPFGVRWFGMREAQQKLGLTGVMWTVIGRDWTLPAPAIAGRILRHASPGGIICLHDGRGTLKNPDVEPTLEAVRRLLPELLEKGYHFETASELLCLKN